MSNNNVFNSCDKSKKQNIEINRNKNNENNNLMKSLNNKNNKIEIQMISPLCLQDFYHSSGHNYNNYKSIHHQGNNKFDMFLKTNFVDDNDTYFIPKTETNNSKPLKTIKNEMDSNLKSKFEQKDEQENKNQNQISNKPQPPIWNNCYETILFTKCYQSLLDSNETLNYIKKIFNQIVEMEYIDWHEIEPFIMEGRIYAVHDYAEFRCEIYNLQNTQNVTTNNSTPTESNKDNTKCAIFVHRIFGDGWIFEEFRMLFLQRLVENNCIIDDNNIEFMCTMNTLKKNDIDYNLTNLNNNVQINRDTFTIDEAKELVFNAIDCNEEREILRDNVLSLRYAIDDKNKLTQISQIDNVLYYLLQPIAGENQIYDTWLIKTMLEIIFKLMKEQKRQLRSTTSTSFSSLSLNNAINILSKIKQQWAHFVEHPLGITNFYPSQQIVRIINKLQQTFMSQKATK